MAKIRITFEDNEDGTVHINMESDEILSLESDKLPKSLEGFTQAQQAAVMALDYIFNMIDGVERVDDDTRPEEAKTLH